MAEVTRVLIVDDLMITADLLGELLTEHGFQVRVAYRPDAAEMLARQFQPQGLVLDYQMPGTTGVEVLNTIKRELQEPIVVVFYTIYANTPEPQKKMLDCGVRQNAIISKVDVHEDAPRIVEAINGEVD